MTPERALRLYVTSSHQQAGMTCVERRVSNVARVAFQVIFDAHLFDARDEQQRLTRFVRTLIDPVLRHDLQLPNLDRCLCIVVRVAAYSQQPAFELRSAAVRATGTVAGRTSRPSRWRRST